MLRLVFQLIGTHYASGNLNAVEGTVRSILAAVPNDQTALQFLGLVYYRTGRKAEAIRIFDDVPAQSDFTVPARSDSGDDFLSRNGYSATAACHVAANDHNPDLALAWYDLGLTLRELDRPKHAAGAFRCALAARPGFADATVAFNTMTPRDPAPVCAIDPRSRSFPPPPATGPNHSRRQDARDSAVTTPVHRPHPHELSERNEAVMLNLERSETLVEILSALKSRQRITFLAPRVAAHRGTGIPPLRFSGLDSALDMGKPDLAFSNNRPEDDDACLAMAVIELTCRLDGALLDYRDDNKSPKVEVTVRWPS
jgi:tetratricopeptide (TPR) repeat protein